MVATSNATSPDGMCATPIVTAALPMPGSSTPMSAAFRNSTPRGQRAPVAAAYTSSRAPASSSRSPHMSSGGMSAIA
jgi:hypothetical protein